MQRHNPYRDRAVSLQRLGFTTYQGYLQSEFWRTIRARVLHANERRCRRCRGRATQIHHAAYDYATMNGTDLDALIPVCGNCHTRAERSARGLADWERLNTVTLFVMTRVKPRHRPRKSRDARRAARRERRLRRQIDEAVAREAELHAGFKTVLDRE